MPHPSFNIFIVYFSCLKNWKSIVDLTEMVNVWITNNLHRLQKDREQIRFPKKNIDCTLRNLNNMCYPKGVF